MSTREQIKTKAITQKALLELYNEQKRSLQQHARQMEQKAKAASRIVSALRQGEQTESTLCNRIETVHSLE